MFAHKHLLSIDDLSREDIMTILKQARTFEEINERPIKKVPALRGKTVCNLFLEPSTRTRGSFELAEKRLSCDSLNAGGSASSTVKGNAFSKSQTIVVFLAGFSQSVFKFSSFIGR